VFAVRDNVLINGTLKDTVELDSWFLTQLIVMVSTVLYSFTCYYSRLGDSL